MTIKRNIGNFLLFGVCCFCILGILIQKIAVNDLWKLPKSENAEEQILEIPNEESKEVPENQEAEAIVADTEPIILEKSEKEEKVYTFTDCNPSYFDDALFVGDSRTVGLYEYGNLTTADYFADLGMNLYKLEHVTVKIQNQEMTLSEVLDSKDYGKVYLMLGINELGYDFDTTVKRYRELAEKLQTSEPNAVIYLCANLHMTGGKSDSEELFNNPNINRFNAEIEKMADNERFFFLDVNEIFDDEDGNLDLKYTADNAHVLGKYYVVWCDWLCTKAIVK